jgi:hypothetical protein
MLSNIYLLGAAELSTAGARRRHAGEKLLRVAPILIYTANILTAFIFEQQVIDL